MRIKEKDKDIDESEERFHIHTTISKKYHKFLTHYAKKKDENGKSIFGNQSKVIEKALELLDNYYNPKKNEIRNIWCRARDELNMLLVGKTTFLSYIKGEIREAHKKNIAIEAIEWYLGKRKEEMNLEEFLKGLKGMWCVANYFYKIELEKNEKGTFQMRFNHDLTKDYSIYWAGYFEKLLVKNWECFVEYFIRNESFYLIIKENN